MLQKKVAPTLAAHRRPLIWAGAAVGGLVLLWIVAYVAAGGGIARGTTVLGVDIGGMSRTEARATLERELADDAAAEIPVRVGEETFKIKPAASGLALDVPATVDRAGDRSWNPVSLVARLFGAETVEPEVAIDQAALTKSVDAFAKRVDGKPVAGDVSFDGSKIVTVDPEQGRALDRPGTVEALRSSYLLHDGPVRLPAKITDPAVGQAEVDRAVSEFAEPAMSAPVTLVVDGERATVPVRLVGPALSMTPDDQHRLRPELDGAALKKLIAPVIDPLEVDARDATFRIRAGRPTVVPSEQGRSIDRRELRDAMLAALTETGTARTATVALRVSEPELSTEQAAGLGVTELVSEFTTYYPTDFPPRLTNIHRAADLMDRTLVLPGDEFSMNDAVGERTEERGFAEGYIINHGKLEVDFGGGVSQLATTTFNAAFFAGLEDVEHHPHSFYISRYPEGREATVAWGVKDLRFRNDSANGVLVTTSYTDGSVSVRIWGTKRYRIEATKSARLRERPFETVHDRRQPGTRPGDCVPQEGVPGFQVNVTRLFFQGGRQVRDEQFHTAYQPEDRIICGSTGPNEGADRPTD